MSAFDLLFVCLGNICRSTMAEQVARAQAADRALGLRIDSAGVSDWERGNPLDPRAAKCLSAHGYPVGDHRAHLVTDAELGSGLIIGMERSHLDDLASMGAPGDRLALITDFVPGDHADGLPDPWYGDMSDFEFTLKVIEAAMPAILDDAASLRP